MWSFERLNATYFELRATLPTTHLGAATYFDRMRDAGISFEQYQQPLQQALQAVSDNKQSLHWLVIAALLSVTPTSPQPKPVAVPLGASKIGGAPHLPEGWTNPPHGAAPNAVFYAQINLRDVMYVVHVCLVVCMYVRAHVLCYFVQSV